MNFTIFYAWQNDRPPKGNRYLIRDALQDAIDSIARGSSIEDSPRTEDGAPQPSLDHDTKDVPGTPEIARAILEKIDRCGILVADLTYVATYSTESRVKHTPNANVLLELGYAIARIGTERIVCVLNDAYGGATELPFDLQHRRHPISYSLATSDDRGSRKEARGKLADVLEEAIRAIMNSSPLRNVDRAHRRTLINVVDDPNDHVRRYLATVSAKQPDTMSAEFILSNRDFTRRAIYLLASDVGPEHITQTAEEEAALIAVVDAYRRFRPATEALDTHLFAALHPKGGMTAPGYTGAVAGAVIRIAIGATAEDASDWVSTTSFRVGPDECAQAHARFASDQTFRDLLNAAIEHANACFQAIARLKEMSSFGFASATKSGQ